MSMDGHKMEDSSRMSIDSPNLEHQVYTASALDKRMKRSNSMVSSLEKLTNKLRSGVNNQNQNEVGKERS